jgi:hypothetical protein
MQGDQLTNYGGQFPLGMAQKYVDDLSRNVKRGLRTKAEMGWLPSLPPLGYLNRTGPDGRNGIVTDSRRFDIVRKCWDLMLTGSHTSTEIRSIASTVFGLRTIKGMPIGRNTLYRLFSNSFLLWFLRIPERKGFLANGPAYTNGDKTGIRCCPATAVPIQAYLRVVLIVLL